MRSRLEQSLKLNSLLVGVGNILRGDDGFGPVVVKNLQGKTSLPLLDAGSAPENLLGPLRKLAPAVIIIVDAVSLDAPAGSLHWIEPQDLERGGVSTHALSFDLLLAFIKQHDPQVKVHILGVVPARVEFGAALSESVQHAVDEVVSLISTLAPPRPNHP